MNEKNIDWDDLRIFMAIARSGGLSAAAKATRRSAATLGRRMLTLERQLKRELFIRHDRGYELTGQGRTLFDELKETENHIETLTTQPADAEKPLVKISSGTWTTLALLEHLDELAGTPADIRLRFISAENVLDIPHREVVIGIRNQRPTTHNLAARKLSPVEFVPYARKGAPQSWIRVLADTPSARWLDKTIGNNAACEVNAPRNSLDLALAGKGIALLPTFIGDRQKTLHRTNSPIAELSHDQWIVTHQDDRHLPEVRRTIDRLGKVFDRHFN